MTEVQAVTCGGEVAEGLLQAIPQVAAGRCVGVAGHVAAVDVGRDHKLRQVRLGQQLVKEHARVAHAPARDQRLAGHKAVACAHASRSLFWHPAATSVIGACMQHVERMGVF